MFEQSKVHWGNHGSSSSVKQRNELPRWQAKE